MGDQQLALDRLITGIPHQTTHVSPQGSTSIVIPSSGQTRTIPPCGSVSICMPIHRFGRRWVARNGTDWGGYWYRMGWLLVPMTAPMTRRYWRRFAAHWYRTGTDNGTA